MKSVKSYEIENEIVYFHGEEELEANLSDVLTELKEITGNEISIIDDLIMEFYEWEEETQYFGTFSNSGWLDVDIDNLEYACQNVISSAELSKSIGKLKKESKELIESLKNL